MSYDEKYDALIENYAAQFGVPAHLALAQNHAEDGAEDPAAQSKVGAEGLFQLMPATALALLQNRDILRRVLAVPEVSAILGIHYDASLKAQVAPWFPDAGDQWKAVMAAYNCGAGRLHQAITECANAGKDPSVYYNVQSHLPLETSTYVMRIWSEFSQADNPQG